MRILFALSLIALLVGVSVVALIEHDPGYVLISYGNYTMETSLWVGLLLLGLVLLLFYLLISFLYRLISGQRNFRSWLGSRRAEQAQRSTTQGVVSYVEGNWAQARSQLLRGTQNNDAPLVNYLLAAGASEHLQEPERMAEYLQSAGDAEPEAEVAVELLRARNKLREGEYQQALAVLDTARDNPASHPAVLGIMQEAYQGLNDWDQLQALLPELVRQKQLDEQASQRLEREIHTGRLRAASLTDELHSAWRELPRPLKRDAQMLRLYVRRQIDLGDGAGAEKSILRGLKREWDGQLVREYGLIEGHDVAKRLSQAERWLPEHPEDPQLLLCLGRLCLRDNLWGKARDYFESCYRVQPGGEVCAELGRLLVGLGEPKVAAAYYREGLSMSEANLPELPMPDKVVSNHHLLERSSQV